MKKILLALLFIGTVQAHEYSVLDQQGLFYLIKAEQKLCEIVSVGGMPKFIVVETIAENKNVILLKYFAGTAGTHDLIDSYRACIYDLKKQQALADIPYQYHSDNHKMRQPELKFSTEMINVYDAENGQHFEIKLSN